MTRLRKKKINKGIFWSYKGHTLWKHHSYQSNKSSSEIMLMYDKDGNETYFKTWKDAKKYVRQIAHQEKPKDEFYLKYGF